MKFTTNKLSELQKELKQVVKDVETGHLTPHEAADKITSIREEMDMVIQRLRNSPNSFDASAKE